MSIQNPAFVNEEQISRGGPFYPSNYGYPGSPYPGIGGSTFPGQYNPSTQLITQPASPLSKLPFNLGNVKGMIDRFGGIDGIVSTVTKMQKIIQSFQQLSPMFKLILGSFGGKAKTSKTNNARRSYPNKRRKKPATRKANSVSRSRKAPHKGNRR